MATPLTIPLTQKAATLEDHNAPIVVIGECLIKLEHSVCHSDLYIRNADWAKKSKLPLIGGHEFGIGRVGSIGAHTASAIKVGDRVGIKWIGNVNYKK
jgi:propanol-preferring alcohol dehydrogenase